ncbi:MAG: disulfide oxidoreductase, partial [Pseudomonadota bacterium]
GFRFIADPKAGAEEQKKLRAASLGALQGYFAHRADKFYNAPDTEMDVTEQGGLMWGEIAVGRLEAGPDALSPQVRAFADEMLEPPVVEKIERRLSHFINRRIAAQFEPLTAMRDDEAVAGLAKGVAYQLVESLGVLERRAVADDIKALDQEARGLLRKHGVRFGQHSIFMPLLLKPAPTRLRLVLWGLKENMGEIPEAPPPGHVTIPAVHGAPEGFYIRAGYRLASTRAIRIDMLERLADMLRDKDGRAGFEATADMLSITGMTLEQFADLMGGLGFKAEKGERPKAPKEEAKAEAPADAATVEQGSPTEGIDPSADEGAETASPVETSGNAPEPITESEAPSETTQEAPVETASETATETSAEAEAPAEPEVEVFYTFTLARRPGGGRDRGRKPGGRSDQQQRQGKGKRPPKGAKGGKPRDEKPRQYSAKPEKKADPDSPFAILSQLKN